jgi:hypothetical protein
VIAIAKSHPCAPFVPGQQHFVGKETDRRWEFGDDLSVLRSKSMEYRPRTTIADATLRKQVEAAGIDRLVFKLSDGPVSQSNCRRELKRCGRWKDYFIRLRYASIPLSRIISSGWPLRSVEKMR